MKGLVAILSAVLLGACAAPAVNDGVAGSAERAKTAAVGAAVPGVDFSSYLTRGALLPEFTRVELDNGAVLLLLEKPDVPLVGFEAIVRGGAVADPPGRAGTASLLAELLRKGSGARDAAEFAATVEGLGGQLDTGAGLENLRVSGEFLSRDAELAVSLLADLLIRPRLEAAEFAKLQQRSVQFIKAAKDGSPAQLVPLYASSYVFPGHVYGQPSSGDETSLAQLGIEDIEAYYRDHVGADRLILAVAGDFDTDEMVALLDGAFGRWRKAAASLPQYGSAPRVAGGRVLLVDKPDATQTYFWIGNVGVSKYYPRRAGLNLANTVFGGSFTSMLNTELRIRTGLTYGARSRISQPREAGTVGISSYTATETTVDAIDLALATLERLHADGLEPAAITSAKSYVLGQFPLAFETAGQLARQAARLEFYELEPGWINAYAPEVVAAGKTDTDAVIDDVYPARDELVFVMIGNAAAIRDQVSKYGQVTEMSIRQPRFHP